MGVTNGETGSLAYSSHSMLVWERGGSKVLESRLGTKGLKNPFWRLRSITDLV